jgi:hypothetical protein
MKAPRIALTGLTSVAITLSTPLALALAEEHEGRERGVRIDHDFHASHPIEWIAIGVAITAAIVLAYVAGQRSRKKKD